MILSPKAARLVHKVFDACANSPTMSAMLDLDQNDRGYMRVIARHIEAQENAVGDMKDVEDLGARMPLKTVTVESQLAELIEVSKLMAQAMMKLTEQNGAITARVEALEKDLRDTNSRLNTFRFPPGHGR